MAAQRRRRHDDHEEHENHERWLITYADMITLLMVLFIVLFAISQVDLAKFEKLKDGLTKSFGGRVEPGLLDGEAGLLADGTRLDPAQLEAAGDALLSQQAKQRAVVADRRALAQTRTELEHRLSELGLDDEVRFRLEQRGLVVTIVTDQVLFAPGSAQLTSHGRDILAGLSGPLADLPNPLSVEGHTDDVPISTARFGSNWELSVARSTSVLRALAEEYGIAGERLSASGYADTRPVLPNDTAEGRAANRRVEVVVHSLVEGAAVSPEAATEPVIDDGIVPIDTGIEPIDTGIHAPAAPTGGH